jgi:hypothetical protein
VSVSHRSHGSTGQRQDPGKTFKNKKMAGHMGVERVTTQNLKVVSDRRRARPDPGRGRGARRQGRLDLVRDAVKKALPKDAPKPGKFRKAAPLLRAKPRLPPAGAGGRVSDGTEGHHPRRRKDAGSVDAVRRDLRSRAARRHPARMVRWQLAKRRAGTHKTKNRAEIARTGKKMYKQKGTGRARHGSARRRSSAAAAGLRSGRAQPCARSAEEGARAGAEARALGQGQGRRHRSCSTRRRRRAEDQGARRRSSRSSG